MARVEPHRDEHETQSSAAGRENSISNAAIADLETSIVNGLDQDRTNGSYTFQSWRPESPRGLALPEQKNRARIRSVRFCRGLRLYLSQGRNPDSCRKTDQ